VDGEWCLEDAIREGNLDVAGILREALFPVTKTE
jgi:hypothetical protein